MTDQTLALGPDRVAPKPPQNVHRADIETLVVHFNSLIRSGQYDEVTHGTNPVTRRLTIKCPVIASIEEQPPEYRKAVYAGVKDEFKRAGWTSVWLTFEADTTRVRVDQMILSLDGPCR